MTGRPSSNEAAPYYFNYINRIAGDDIAGTLETQLDETLALLRDVSEEESLLRYAPDKWSLREMWNHVNDAERVFVFRAFWFARALPEALPSFEQDLAVPAAKAGNMPWAAHVEEFGRIRLATISFFRNLPADAWMRSGMASGHSFTVRACAYIVGGHVSHHAAILREKYLVARAGQGA
jgi:DinB superfamily